ncbi:MAG: ECF RNA polymerase sigma factor SigE [Ignavibacteria bacterium]|nr:ECF RNA polymerase sigma factor SigE [Ignavibacteria bacterium]
MSSGAVSLNLIVKNPDEDIKLVKSSLQGNGEAFKELFMKHVSKINFLCRKLSADPHTADDITQEVFIKAWEKLNTFKFESKFSTWLHSIAANQFLMHLRKENRISQKEESYKSGYTESQIKQETDSRIDLEKAISKIPENARAVLVLHDIEGYKHNEISEMMNIEIGTSKAHLHKARKILREELSK